MILSLGCDGGDETNIESKGQTVLQKTCFTGLASLKDRRTSFQRGLVIVILSRKWLGCFLR